ncbi:MAG: archease, partial [Bauldia sp.]|nr:archease [Bauldia sp.]
NVGLAFLAWYCILLAIELANNDLAALLAESTRGMGVGWHHFAHDADIGVCGRGRTVAEAFEQAAVALTAIVTGAKVWPRTEVHMACHRADLELLFVDWLDAVIYEMAVRKMLFGRFAVGIDSDALVSAGGVGFDISCGVRTMLTGLSVNDVLLVQKSLADGLYNPIPAGVGSEGKITLDAAELVAMLGGDARWAVDRRWGATSDLERIEEGGCVSGARPDSVSERAGERQRREMGTLGSGSHYLEVQAIAEIFDEVTAAAFGIEPDRLVVAIHCGSRGLGHQIGSEFLKETASEAAVAFPDRELACAPIRSELGQRYLGAMRAAINCALANREILGHLARRVFRHFFPEADLALLFDVSHNTCKLETHLVDGSPRELFVHRKGATRSYGPGHPSLPEALRAVGQPVLIGSSMGNRLLCTRGHGDERGEGVLLGLPRGRTRDFAPRRGPSVVGAQGGRRPGSPGNPDSQPVQPRRRGRSARRLQGRRRCRSCRRTGRSCQARRAAKAACLHQGVKQHDCP